MTSPNISPLTQSSRNVASEYQPTSSEVGSIAFVVPKLFTQEDFSNLVRDANLTRKSAEVVASRLKQRNLVTGDFLITAARKRRNTEHQ